MIEIQRTEQFPLHKTEADEINAELLAALKEIIGYWDDVVPPEHLSESHKAGRSAIARAEGGAA